MIIMTLNSESEDNYIHDKRNKVSYPMTIEVISTSIHNQLISKSLKSLADKHPLSDLVIGSLMNDRYFAVDYRKGSFMSQVLSIISNITVNDYNKRLYNMVGISRYFNGGYKFDNRNLISISTDNQDWYTYYEYNPVINRKTYITQHKDFAK